MQKSTMLLIALAMILINISVANGDTCRCTCCSGNKCQPSLQGVIPMKFCSPASCQSICQNQYPRQCASEATDASYDCVNERASTPNWIGEFNVTGKCNRTTCCCPDKKVSITERGPNRINFHLPLAGNCQRNLSFLSAEFDKLTVYDASLEIFGHTISMELFKNNSKIDFKINNNSCIETAERVNKAACRFNVNSLFFVLLLVFISCKQMMGKSI